MDEFGRETATKEHIRNLVENYDEVIRKLIPQYEQMQNHVVNRLEFPAQNPITVLDIGIGTGETAQRILHAFPACQIVGVDISPEMIDAAKLRLVKHGNQIQWITGNMFDVNLPNQIDAVVSTLAVHHLTDEQKRSFYSKLYGRIKPGGVISIGDLVTFKNPEKASKTEMEWKNFIFKNLGPEQGQYRFDEYKKGDIPAPLEDQLEWLKEAGFENVSIDWELMNYAVFGGRKS